MTHLAALALSGVVWTGTAVVDVMNWEGGGEHPYRTTFVLKYREAPPTPIYDAKGRLVGRRSTLVAETIALKVEHEVRGLLNCVGTGEEVVGEGSRAELVVPLPGEKLAPIVGFDVPAGGAYQLLLPRAYAAYACGHNRRNAGDRAAGVGSGLFFPDAEFSDRGPRLLDATGSRMQGSYSYRRERSADGSLQHLVRKEIRVEWDLRRTVEP